MNIKYIQLIKLPKLLLDVSIKQNTFKSVAAKPKTPTVRIKYFKIFMVRG